MQEGNKPGVDFIYEPIVRDLEIPAEVAEFSQLMEKMCRQTGKRFHRRVPSRKLWDALRERGVVDGGKSGNDRFWSGVRLKYEAERIVAEQAALGQSTLL